VAAEPLALGASCGGAIAALPAWPHTSDPAALRSAGSANAACWPPSAFGDGARGYSRAAGGWPVPWDSLMQGLLQCRSGRATGAHPGALARAGRRAPAAWLDVEDQRLQRVAPVAPCGAAEALVGPSNSCHRSHSPRGRRRNAEGGSAAPAAGPSGSSGGQVQSCAG